MSADANPREIIPGGNFMLWMDLLASPFIWLCQFELSYALVPWACKGGHSLILRLAWIPFFLLIFGIGLLSLRDWGRLGAAADGSRAMARCRFMAALGIMVSALFALATLVQAAAIFILDPCAH